MAVHINLVICLHVLFVGEVNYIILQHMVVHSVEACQQQTGEYMEDMKNICSFPSCDR